MRVPDVKKRDDRTMILKRELHLLDIPLFTQDTPRVNHEHSTVYVAQCILYEVQCPRRMFLLWVEG